MGQIKLYKKFYSVNIVRTGNTIDQNYTLINPYSISANTYVAGSGASESSSLIESSLDISQYSTGIYFADLNPYLYASDVTYDLVWFINYTSSAPLKKLSTRFRINVNTVTNQIEIEYLNLNLEIDITEPTIELDVSDSNLEIGFTESSNIDISDSPNEIEIL